MGGPPVWDGDRSYGGARLIPRGSHLPCARAHPVRPRARSSSWRSALAGLWLVAVPPVRLPQQRLLLVPPRGVVASRRASCRASTKRGPIFPAAIAALAPAMPGEQPELARRARREPRVLARALPRARALRAAQTFPEAAPLFAVLLATTPVLHAAALQPLLEPSLGLFVALAFLGLRARSPWQYAAAGAAALSRPDAIVLVAILAAANALAERRFAATRRSRRAAALPCLVWYSLGAARRRRRRTSRCARRTAPARRSTSRSFPRSSSRAGGGDGTACAHRDRARVAAPAAFGAWRAWRTAPRETGAMLAWFALSCAIVVLYGVGKTRYVHPIAFVPLLCLAVGVAGARAAGRRRGSRGLPRPAQARRARRGVRSRSSRFFRCVHRSRSPSFESGLRGDFARARRSRCSRLGRR